MKHEGQIAYFNDVKQYAIITEKVPSASGGWYVEKYFMPVFRVAFQMSPRVVVGQYGRFDVGPNRPRNPGEYRLARNVELFDDAEQMRVYIQATSAQEVA